MLLPFVVNKVYQKIAFVS